MAEYVLPKFEIGFDSPDEFSLADKKAHVIVRAKYTNGKSLRGTAVVSIKDNENNKNIYYHCQFGSENRVFIEKTITVDGQEKIEFDIKDELKCEESKENKTFDMKSFTVKAEVAETLTGLSQSVEKTIKIYKEPFNIVTDLNAARLKKDSTVNVTVRKLML